MNLDMEKKCEFQDDLYDFIEKYIGFQYNKMCIYMSSTFIGF
jgi:hypothetical protein